MAQPPRIRQPESFLERLLVAVASGLALFAAGLLLIVFAFQVRYLGRVYPGVQVSGVDLSGVRRTQVTSLLVEGISYSSTGLIAMSDSGQSWAYAPAELGLILDTEGTAEGAFNVGREGWFIGRWLTQFKTWRDGVAIPPQMIFDGRMAQHQIEQIARQINRPSVEAALSVNGLDVVINPAQIGRTVEVAETVALVEAQILSLQDGSVTLAINEQTPAILDVSEQANIARTIISQPLTLGIPDADEGDFGPWVFTQETLANMLAIERVQNGDTATYQVGLDSQKLRNFLAPLAPGLGKSPKNARFIFNDDTNLLEVIEQATIGREMLVEASLMQINEELAQGNHTINLVFDYSNPSVTDQSTGEDLGITELVSAQTTYFYGSSEARIHNIQTAAAQFHGLLVPPGATFSMAEDIGDISLDSGYAEALIIYGDRTIQGVGGGVCQVSTTLFRAVFFGGFPVEERYSHAYRVYYYELNRSGSVNETFAGLDATVYTPLIDFKFTNDTPYWLLMETYVNPGARTITWKFYSTSDGRTVSWDTTGLQNVEEPPDPIYEENEELEKGEVEQVDWAAEGADVTITRVVTRDGETIHNDEFTTHYQPWGEIWQYGPGTKGYPPDDKNNED